MSFRNRIFRGVKYTEHDVHVVHTEGTYANGIRARVCDYVTGRARKWVVYTYPEKFTPYPYEQYVMFTSSALKYEYNVHALSCSVLVDEVWSRKNPKKKNGSLSKLVTFCQVIILYIWKIM